MFLRNNLNPSAGFCTRWIPTEMSCSTIEVTANI